MSRRLAGAVLAAVTVLSVAACGKTDITAQWPALAAPTGWEPEVGTCHSAFNETSPRASYRPVDCASSHGYETVHVGTFTGAAASQDRAPARGSKELAAAWTECDAKTSEYVGGPWRDALVWIGVSVPSDGAWRGGARWFRCEAGVTTYRIGDISTTKQSLKGVLAGPSQLRRGCFQIPADEDADWAPTACTANHNAEYVGSFISTFTYEQLQSNFAAAHQKCRSLIAKYVGVPDNNDMRFRTGSYYSYASRRDWDDGDRGVRCHLWLSARKLTSSLKGGGTKVLPIN